MVSCAINAALSIEALRHVHKHHSVIRPLKFHHNFLLFLFQILHELLMDLFQSSFFLGSLRHALELLSFVTFVGLDRFYHILN